jgi:hypothetical protein
MDDKAQKKQKLLEIIDDIFDNELLEVNITDDLIGDIIGGKPRIVGKVTLIKIVSLVKGRCKNCDTYDECGFEMKETVEEMVENKDIDLSGLL